MHSTFARGCGGGCLEGSISRASSAITPTRERGEYKVLHESCSDLAGMRVIEGYFAFVQPSMRVRECTELHEYDLSS